MGQDERARGRAMGKRERGWLTRRQDDEDRYRVRRSTFGGRGLADGKDKPIDGKVYMLQSNNNVGRDKTKLPSRWRTESRVVASTCRGRMRHCNCSRSLTTVYRISTYKPR